ncbi:helix-turn-helix domain-containing protein [Novosphingopyxis sp.]|uniref:helix-turn-helix domain-containing protein n=1 Tax=Novosphingopyxis sp. TaxID=2709690 RepID=UPI003B5C141D
MTVRLSEKEIVCLRGVAELKSSKAIARDLGISSHTVDARLKRAIAKLDATDRFDAARIYQAGEETADSGGPEVRTLVYQTPDVPQAPGFPPQASPSPDGVRNDEGSTTRLRDNAFAADWTQRSSYFPVPAYRGERNGLTGLQRLGWIVAIAVGSVVIFGGLMGGLSALSTLFD